MTPGHGPRPIGARRRLSSVAMAAAVAAGAVAAAQRPRRVVVEGWSMEPTLAPGDRLLVVRRRRLRVGDIVAVRDPRGHRVLVKRVSALIGDDVVVRGDNPVASTDSATLGALSRRAVLGRVVRRYAPAWRAGPVR